MSRNEMFVPLRTWDENLKRHRNFQAVICSGCARQENIPVTGKVALPPEAIVKKMQHSGWVMGRTRANDLCPECVTKRAAERRASSAAPSPVPGKPAIVKGDTEVPAIQSVKPQIEPPVLRRASEEPPREMGTEDRRIIFAELNDVYLDPARGYAAGVTDETVAKKLDVPRKWVETVRAEFFGPAHDAELTAIKKAITDLESAVAAQEMNCRELRNKINEAKARLGATLTRLGVAA